MKKQIVRGFSMVVLLIGLTTVTAVVSAGQSNRVDGNIPFDFIVGDKVLPAGQYTVRGIGSGNEVILISRKDAKSSVLRLTNLLQPNMKNTHARLVFHRYGQNYFLAEVWSGGDSVGRRLMRSRRERAIERELAAVVSKAEFAGNTFETVELLAVVR